MQRRFMLPELEDEQKDQFETSPLMDELARQQAPTTNIPDMSDIALEREVSAADEIANEAQDLETKQPDQKMQYEQMLSQFAKLKPQEQSAVQDDLKALQNEANKKNKNLNWFRIGDKVAQAYGQRYGGKVAGMQDIYDSLEKQAQQPVLDYKNLQKNQLDKLGLQLQQEQIDPSSPLAKTQRDINTQLAKEAGIDLQDYGDMSAKSQEQQMRSLAYILGNRRQAEQSEMNRQQRNQDILMRMNEAREARKDKKEVKEAAKLDKDVETISKRIDSAQIIPKNSALSSINDYLNTKFNVNLNSDEKDLKKVDIEGIGFLGAMRPDFLTNKEDVAFRQQVSSLANSLLKDRSGAAVTDQEYARFLKEIGSGNFSSEANLLSGLKKMQKDIEDQNKNIGKIYGKDVLDEYQSRTGLQLRTEPESNSVTSGSSLTPEQRRKRIQELKAKQGK
jgi:hypothetical protein